MAIGPLCFVQIMLGLGVVGWGLARWRDDPRAAYRRLRAFNDRRGVASVDEATFVASGAARRGPLALVAFGLVLVAGGALMWAVL